MAKKYCIIVSNISVENGFKSQTEINRENVMPHRSDNQAETSPSTIMFNLFKFTQTFRGDNYNTKLNGLTSLNSVDPNAELTKRIDLIADTKLCADLSVSFVATHNQV